MDMTPAKMKIGDRLMLGKYGVRNDSPQPLIWLKASPNRSFITENVADYLCFDAKEFSSNERDHQYYGNKKYSLSNIRSFLNSDMESWFHRTHEMDAPPGRRSSGAQGEYENHYGFLYHFEEYEIDSLMFDTVTVDGENVCSLIRLPFVSEIIGADRFPLFARRGVRPKGTDDMVQNRHFGFDYNSYIDFWALGADRTRSPQYTGIISRTGTQDSTAPSTSCGVRPVCRLKSDTPLEMDENGVWRIKPYTIQQNICTSDELLSFLGIAQP